MIGRILIVAIVIAAPPVLSGAQTLCEDPSAYCRQALDAACIQRERVGAAAIAAADVAASTDCAAQFDSYRKCLTRVPTECGTQATSSGSCSPEDARQIFGTLADSTSIGQLEAFIAACPETPQAMLARARLADLRDAASRDEVGDEAPAPPGPVGSTDTAPSNWAGDSRHPGDTFRDCGFCPKMAVIPGGSFLMGSPASEPGREEVEGPQRTVRLEPFALGVHEVTFQEWDACANAGGCRQIRPGGDWRDGDQGWGRGDRPVITVSWNDAQQYVAWLNSRTEDAPYRLPSEAEWEYAARAGTETAYFWGDAYDASRIADGERTEPVGGYPANGFGLHDVHGNVLEWVQDCWNTSYVDAPTDGSAWASGECARAVLRGGAWWHDHPQDSRAAARRGTPRPFQSYSAGFRVARTLSE